MVGTEPARPLIVVAMSGGVDSSVVAALLSEAGFRIRGATLRMWDAPHGGDRVCSDHRDAARVAAHLGIDHCMIDCRDDFHMRVVKPFLEGYAVGRTPNPCMACNSGFKFGDLLDWAVARGAERLATGHYARIRQERGTVRLFRGADPDRDQSYFLFPLTQRQLARSLFPLGELTKVEVRAHARRLALPVAEKRDSQDLCFGNPAAFLRRQGRGGVRGAIVDEEARVVGEHKGIEGFTVGQRRGLGVSSGTSLYVQSIDGSSHRVKVGPRPPETMAITATNCHWITEPPAEAEPLLAQVRYRQRPVAATIEILDGSAGRARCRVRFVEPVRAPAPGQAVAVYRGEEVVGGGWIDSCLPASRGR